MLTCLVTVIFATGGCEPEDERASGQQLLEQIPGFDARAIVVLAYLGRFQQGGVTLWPRAAFVVGDGTLIVTAAHCVGDLGDRRQQAVSPDIVVISPYYGDVFDFEILAIDKEADVAVLKAKWPSHPALNLGNKKKLKAAKELLIASRPCTPPNGKVERPFRVNRQLDAEKLPIMTPVAQGPNTAITLKGTRKVANGWSGSPIVLDETGEVVGVLGQLMGVSRKKAGPVVRRDAGACSIESIEALLKENGLESQARMSPPSLPQIEDANEGFDLAVDYIEASLNKDIPGAVEIAREFVALRPKSVQGHLFLGFASHNSDVLLASDANMVVLAEASFKEALLLDPNSARAHAGYGNFLANRKRYKEALVETERALAIDPNTTIVTLTGETFDGTAIEGTDDIKLVGDLDGDGSVGIVDLNILLTQWGKTGPGITDLRADTDLSGDIGLEDLNAVLMDWGK